MAAQVLDEFYCNLGTVGVSAITGEGMHELFDAAEACRAEYYRDYKPDLDKRLQARLALRMQHTHLVCVTQKQLQQVQPLKCNQAFAQASLHLRRVLMPTWQP